MERSDGSAVGLADRYTVGVCSGRSVDSSVSVGDGSDGIVSYVSGGDSVGLLNS